MEIVGVTSKKEKNFSIRFEFLESEKEDNVTWILEVRQTMLKDKENMLNVIVIDRIPHWWVQFQMCFLHHMHYFIGNMSQRMWELDLRTMKWPKIKGEDEKIVKDSVIL